MILGLRTVMYHVADLNKAKEWYAQVLGFQPYFDEPFYVGFNVNGYELGLHPVETELVKGGSTFAYCYHPRWSPNRFSGTASASKIRTLISN